jgi:hypothetical protein
MARPWLNLALFLLLAAPAGQGNPGEPRLTPFEADGKWGFINKKGAIVVPLKFERAESFQNGRARVKLDGQWRYVDRKGKPIEQASLGSATMEEDGTIVLQLRAEGPEL